ncbi:MAG TPA: hypothetical protein VG738_09075 [Chitinophagaceae bacterium]|nr:hypothetical protein [Chitinophagaceae bacterium]
MRFPVIFVTFILIGFFFFYGFYRKEEDTKRYLVNLDLKMRGVLLTSPDCQNGFNGFCILNVRVIKGNIRYYNPVGKENAYFAEIKNDTALLFQDGVGNLKKGDTIIVDTKAQSITCNGLRYSILLNDDYRFYNYVNKNYSLF